MYAEANICVSVRSSRHTLRWPACTETTPMFCKQWRVQIKHGSLEQAFLRHSYKCSRDSSDSAGTVASQANGNYRRGRIRLDFWYDSFVAVI